MMREYVATVIKAHEERDATHANEAEARKQAIKSGDPEDPVIHLLEATCRAACAQTERAVDAFLKRIKETLLKHIPVTAQGPLIANALSIAFQFQMSVWQMVGNEWGTGQMQLILSGSPSGLASQRSNCAQWSTCLFLFALFSTSYAGIPSATCFTTVKRASPHQFFNFSR